MLEESMSKTIVAQSIRLSLQIKEVLITSEGVKVKVCTLSERIMSSGQVFVSPVSEQLLSLNEVTTITAS